jgi:DNA-binding MarR family transcriptional regulator
MDQQTFRQAILLLSGDHSVSILRSLRDGNWHLSSEVARSLRIHITTASKFLQRFSELGLVERRPHDARTFEYRLRSSRLRFEVDLDDEAGPLREVVDFYVAYFHSLFERIRYVGTPAIEVEMEHRLTTDHQELRRAVFEQMVDGSEAGLDRLRDLVAAVHRDLWSVCAQGLGTGTARGVFQAALRDAIGVYPDLAYRCGLSRPLEA